eukprot:scaffold102679_cov38-Phaeocystis_antarctica.AAC.1
MRIRRPVLQERHLVDLVQLRLLTSGCGCWRLPARSTVASPAVLFFSRTAQKSEEPRACLPSASHRQALARGRGSSSAPAVTTVYTYARRAMQTTAMAVAVALGLPLVPPKRS